MESDLEQSVNDPWTDPEYKSGRRIVAFVKFTQAFLTIATTATMYSARVGEARRDAAAAQGKAIRIEGPFDEITAVIVVAFVLLVGAKLLHDRRHLGLLWSRWTLPFFVPGSLVGIVAAIMGSSKVALILAAISPFLAGPAAVLVWFKSAEKYVWALEETRLKFGPTRDPRLRLPAWMKTRWFGTFAIAAPLVLIGGNLFYTQIWRDRITETRPPVTLLIASYQWPDLEHETIWRPLVKVGPNQLKRRATGLGWEDVSIEGVGFVGQEPFEWGVEYEVVVRPYKVRGRWRDELIRVERRTPRPSEKYYVRDVRAWSIAAKPGEPRTLGNDYIPFDCTKPSVCKKLEQLEDEGNLLSAQIWAQHAAKPGEPELVYAVRLNPRK